MNELEKVLVLARSRVSMGWCQGAAQVGGNVCAGAAMVLGWKEVRGIPLDNQSFDADALYHQMIDIMLEAINELDPFDYWVEIPVWNDIPDRTHEEVVETFDRAIKIAERGDVVVEMPERPIPYELTISDIPKLLAALV
jgi:hypothetical protein